MRLGTRLLVPLLPALLLPAGLLHAQDSTAAVDPRVVAVVAGGHWTAEGRGGYYRLVLRTRGENVPADLTIEWLTDGSGAKEPIIIQAAKVKELSGAGRLERPQIGGFLKGWRAWVLQSDSHTPGGQLTRAIDLGPPGEFRVRPKQ